MVVVARFCEFEVIEVREVALGVRGASRLLWRTRKTDNNALFQRRGRNSIVSVKKPFAC